MRVKFLINNPLRARIVSVSLILILILSMSYILLFKQFDQNYQSAVEKERLLSQVAANSLDDFLSENKEILKELASLEAITKGQGSEVQGILETFSSLIPEASAFWVARNDGVEIAQFPENSQIQSQLKPEDWQLIDEKAFVRGPYPDKATGEEVIILTQPYYQDLNIVGTVGMSIPLSELQKELAEIEVGQSGYVTLIKRDDGQILSHPDLEQYRQTYTFEASPIYKKVKDENLTSGHFENAKEQRMHYFQMISEAPWIVIVAEPIVEFNWITKYNRMQNLALHVMLLLVMMLIIHYLFTLRDMKNADKNMKNEKLALVGELAAGIAHEIRNPLTSIKGFAQLIYEKKGQELPSFYYETILEELDRIDQIVGEMVVLAKPAQETKKKIDLAKVLQDSVNLMNYQAYMREIGLILKLDEELPPIEGISNQLKQVFINLIKNAIEAIENTGIVTIEAIRHEDRVIITVEDTGPGMDIGMIDKLGTPFFSTKEQGTGLGLMITFRIIQNHKGKVSVESKLGKGTQFIISFPISPTGA